MLDVSLLIIGLFCINRVNVLQKKKRLFGSMLLVGSLRWKKGASVLVK